MLTSCGICSGWERRSSRDGTHGRSTLARPLPVQAPTAFVRIRPRGRSVLRRAAHRARPPLPCCYASAPAAVGSR